MIKKILIGVVILLVLCFVYLFFAFGIPLSEALVDF